MTGLLFLVLLGAGQETDQWVRAPAVAVNVVASSAHQTVLDVHVADPGIPAPGEQPQWPLGFVAVGDDGPVSATAQPPGSVTVGEPVIWRELRVAPVWIRTDLLTGAPRTIAVVTGDGPGPNPKTRPRRAVGPAFEELYRSFVLNYDWLEFPPASPRDMGAVYLVVCPDYLVTQAQTLARWHHEAGLLAKVTTLSDMGGTTYQTVKNYLQTAYDTWTPAPEYVQILGDVTGNTSQDFPAKVIQDLVEPSNYHSDHWYSLLEGSDYFADVLIARIPGQSTSSMTYMVQKILDHERQPYIETVISPWQKKATMVSGSYGPWPSIDATKRLNAQRLVAAGYEHVDSLFTSLGATANDVVQAVNQGRSLVNYRGYYCSSDGWGTIGFKSAQVNQYIHNGRRLPVVFSVSCFSGDYGMKHCFGEYWLDVYESGWQPRGAAGFFGSTGWTHTRHNNWLDKGLFLGLLFNQQVFRFGPVMDSGKAYLYLTCGVSDTTENTFREYCILGDVAMPLWTSLPGPLAVAHPGTLSVGAGVPFTVTVTDTLGQAIDAALVCLLKEDAEPLEVYLTGETDSAAGGQLVFPVTTQVPGAMLVTVTAQNRVPYQDTVLVWEGDVVPPMAPSALTVEATDVGQARLTWAPVTTDVYGQPEALRQYEVFRSQNCLVDPLPTTPLAVVPVPTTQYVDTTSGVGDPNNNSYYAVVAVDSTWNRSAPSAPAGELDYSTSSR